MRTTTSSNSFVTLCGAGTPFLDGFSTASAAFLILTIPGLDALEIALLTSLNLGGSFLGSLLIGPLADRFGRRPFFIASVAAFAVVTAAAIALPEVAVILFMRLMTGFLVGGDYPVSQAIVTENVTETFRARALAMLMLAWNVGALVAALASLPVLLSSISWTLFFWMQAAVAALLALLRLRVPEPHAWHHAKTTPADGTDGRHPASWNREDLGNLVFCAGFWLCQTIPVTVMMFYAGRILERFTGTTGPVTHMLLLYGFFMVGAIPSTLPFVARRPKLVLLSTFAAMAAGLAMVFPWGGEPSSLAGLGFVLFAFAYGLQAPIDFVYPNLLFRTVNRARSVGVITALARVGATLSAFSFPLFLEQFGAAAVFAGGLVILVLGLVLTVFSAPSDERWAGSDDKNAQGR